jgi:dihydrofolate reductase
MGARCSTPASGLGETTLPSACPCSWSPHRARDTVAKQGGTTYTFVTAGIEAALERARAAAEGKDVAVAGGAELAQQYLNAGLLDSLVIHLVPVLLGDGVRLFDHLAGVPRELDAPRSSDRARSRTPRSEWPR